MAKLLSTDLTSANQAKVLSLLADTPRLLAQLCQAMTDVKARQSPKIDERSIVEILAHLLNNEARSSEAIYLALLLDEPLIADLHPERAWGKLLHYDLLPFPEMLVYFRLRRKILIPVLGGLTVKQWARQVQEPGKQRKESVYWCARALAIHEQEHLAEIENRLTHLAFSPER